MNVGPHWANLSGTFAFIEPTASQIQTLETSQNQAEPRKVTRL